MNLSAKQYLSRHLKTYAALIRFSISRSLEFRVDFLFRVIMDCIFYAITIAFFEVIFIHSNTLGGWEHHQVILFVSGGLLLDAIYMVTIARNMWEFPPLVNKGELDFHIIRPVNTLFFVLTRHFEFTSILNVFIALGIVGYAINQFPDPVSLSQYLGFILLLGNGLVLLLCLRMFAVLPVFWTHSEFGFHMLYLSLEQVMERPEVVFRGVFHLFFTTVVPFIVMTSFPARWFFGSLSWLELVYAPVVTIFFFSLMVYIWQRGLRAYTSASS